MGNNDNRVVTWQALNSFIIQNGGSPKKSSGANSLALKYGEFSEYAPMATATSSGIVISDYTGTGGGAYASNQLVIERDVTWFTYVRPVPTGITVSPKSTTLDVGTASEYPTFVQHTATVTAAADADKSVTWSISDPTKASIDQTGKVTAIAEGTVIVTATTVNGLSDTATVTIVRNNAPVIIDPTSIQIATDPGTTIYVGETTQCTANVLPDTATDRTVTWSSLHPSIATVNSSGLVTGVSQGQAIIVATANADSNVYGTILINVIEHEVEPEGCYVWIESNTSSADVESTSDGISVTVPSTTDSFLIKYHHEMFDNDANIGGENHTMTVTKLSGPDGYTELFATNDNVSIDSSGVAHLAPESGRFQVNVLKHDENVTIKYIVRCDVSSDNGDHNLYDIQQNILTINILKA